MLNIKYIYELYCLQNRLYTQRTVEAFVELSHFLNHFTGSQRSTMFAFVFKYCLFVTV
jgi:hypothetical protein